LAGVGHEAFDGRSAATTLRKALLVVTIDLLGNEP
jgi:hypothetical protein